MEEINAIDFSSLTSTQPLSRRARELEMEELLLKRDFSDLVKNRDSEISECSSKVDELVRALEKFSVVVKNAKRQNRSSLESAISLVTLFSLKRRFARLQQIAQTAESIESLSREFRQAPPGVSLSQQLEHLHFFHDKIKILPAGMASCRAELEKEAKKRTEKFVKNFQETLQQLILNADAKFDKEEILCIASRLNERFGCAKFPRLLATEFCTCVDSLARNSAIAVSDEANATTVILSLCEFISVLVTRLRSLKAVFAIDDANIDQLFGEKISRELIKFLTVHKFGADEQRQAAEIFAHVVNIDREHPDHQLLHHCLEPFSELIDQRLAKLPASPTREGEDLVVRVKYLIDSNAALRRLQTEFPFFAEHVEKQREKLVRKLSAEIISGLDLTLPEIDKSDIYDAQERGILVRRFPTLALTGPGSRRKRSREKLATDRVSVLEFFEQDKNVDFKELGDFIVERTVYDAISDCLTTWCTGVLAAKTEQSVAQVTNKFIAESEKALAVFSGCTLGHAKLLKTRSRELGTQALEALGLVENNKLLNLTAVISMVKARLGDCEVWSAVKEYEAVLKKDELTVEEAVTWAKGHGNIPLRLLAVVVSKRFDADDVKVQQAYEELEVFFRQ